MLLLFLACKNDDLDLPQFIEEGVTVEAYVNANKTPVVYLTTGLPLNGFKEIEFLKSIESTAKVEIVGNKTSEIATFSKDNSRFPSRFYSFDNIKGKVGELYKLKITIGDKVYLSETKVPQKPVLSNISVIKKSTFKEGIYNLKIDLKNPETITYYKFYIKNKKEDKYEKASVFVVSNEFINTSILTVFNDIFDRDENDDLVSLLQNNNSYDLRIVSITKEEFDFWDRVLGSQTEIFNLPNLAQEIPSNISNNGFGFFSGNTELLTSITIE